MSTPPPARGWLAGTGRWPGAEARCRVGNGGRGIYDLVAVVALPDVPRESEG